MGNGRKTKAPCGHVGEVVIGTYVQCAKCDKKAAPKHVEPEKTEPMFVPRDRCPRCGSNNTEVFASGLDALGWYINMPQHVVTQPPEAGDAGCWACGKIWTP